MSDNEPTRTIILKVILAITTFFCVFMVVFSVYSLVKAELTWSRYRENHIHQNQHVSGNGWGGQAGERPGDHSHDHSHEGHDHSHEDQSTVTLTVTETETVTVSK